MSISVALPALTEDEFVILRDAVDVLIASLAPDVPDRPLLIDVRAKLEQAEAEANTRLAELEDAQPRGGIPQGAIDLGDYWLGGPSWLDVELHGGPPDAAPIVLRHGCEEKNPANVTLELGASGVLDLEISRAKNDFSIGLSRAAAIALQRQLAKAVSGYDALPEDERV